MARRTERLTSGRPDRSGGGRRGSGRGSGRGARGKGSGGGALWLYGRHAVVAALENPSREVDRLLATQEAWQKLEGQVDHRSRLEVVDRDTLDRIVGPEAVHQGLAAKVRPLEHLVIEDLLERIPQTEPVQLLVLDEVTDPRNVGAVLRSAAAFGAAGVVVTRHNAADETGALAKAASGALDVVPIAEASNLRRGLEQLKEARIWCLGLDHPAPARLGDQEPPDRLAWVLGAEGRGLRRLTAETCDSLVEIPISPAMESLNVSNAAAVALYEWVRAHGLPED